MGTSPSVKETTLHHFRDPLITHLAENPEVDFLGAVVQATSDDYLHKRYVARRTATALAAMRPDGVLVSVDAWGNAHIDFAAVIEFTGEQGIPVVGLSFVGEQAKFVVTNAYMDAIIDFNKTSDGVENCVIGDNTCTALDALKALAVLKSRLKMKNPQRIFASAPENGLERQMRSLQQFSFAIAAVKTSEVTAIEGRTLSLDIAGLEKSVFTYEGSERRLLDLLEKVQVKILKAGKHTGFVNSVLDFSPIAVKVEGGLGEGATYVLNGVQTMLTAVDSEGLQPINGGAASGALHDVVRFGRCGTPKPADFILHVDVVLKAGEAMTRAGIMAAHLACDIMVDEIRRKMLDLNRYQAQERKRFIEKTRPGLLRVAVVKMVSGVSAMGDTGLFPLSPGGFIGCSSIMDLTHNLPVVVSPNEYLDGLVRSLS